MINVISAIITTAIVFGIMGALFFFGVINSPDAILFGLCAGTFYNTMVLRGRVSDMEDRNRP